MSALAVLAELHTAGIRVRLRADGLLALDGVASPSLALLAEARTHRDAIAALLREEDATPLSVASSPIPGVPPAWCAGVTLLAILLPADAIEPRRWATLASTSTRLLRDHGAELHRAGWDALDLFGLHQRAPTANPAGWGLAWLLDAVGGVLDVSHDAIGICRSPGGARLAYRRRTAAARAEVVPSWKLGRHLEQTRNQRSRIE